MEKKMKKHKLLLTVALFTLTPFMTYASNAEEDGLLAEKLSDLKLNEWAEPFLKDKMNSSDPNEVDLYKISMAVLYYRMRKDKEATQLINEVQPNSPYYERARYTAGIKAYEAGNYDESARLFEDFLKLNATKLKKNPSVEAAEKLERDLAYLITIYKEAKPNPEALFDVLRTQADIREIILQKWLKDNPFGEDDQLPDVARPEDLRLYVCKFALDIYERQKIEIKKAPAEKVKRIIQDLNKLLWKDVETRTNAAAQLLRAYVILDDLGKCPEILKIYTPFSAEADMGYATPENAPFSPRAPFRYYTGVYYLALAQAAKNPEEQIKACQQALSAFYACMKFHYRFELSEPLVASFLDAINLFTSLGKSVPTQLAETNPEIARWLVRDAVTTEAARAMQNKKYDEALPLLLKGYSSSPGSATAKDALIHIFACYMDKKPDPMLLEAVIVSKTLGTRFPQSEMTANTFLVAGTKCREMAQKCAAVKDPMSYVYTEEALELLRRYLELFPTHDKAAQIAYMLARDYYSAAQDLIKLGNATKGQERADYFEKARVAYLEAAEKFNLVITKFGQNQQLVIESWYYLAMSYNLAGEYEKSTAAFENFIKLEKKDMKKLSNAQYTCATNYYDVAEDLYKEQKTLEMKASEYIDTVPKELQEQIATIKKKANENYMKAAERYTYFTGDFARTVLKSNDPIIKNRLATGKIMIAWSYDGAGEKNKAILAFKDYLAYTKNKKNAASNEPKAYSRMAILYTELKDVQNAANALKTLSEKYPTSNEARDARFILGRSMYNVGNYNEAIVALNEMLDNPTDINIPAWRWILLNMIKYPESVKPVTPEMAAVAVRAGEKLLAALEKPNLNDWFSKTVIASLGKGKTSSSKRKIENVLYPIKEIFWLNLARAYTLAENGKNSMAKKGVENYTYIIKPPRDRTLSGEKYVSPYLYETYIERGFANAKAGNAKEGHLDLAKLQTIAASLDRYDLLRKAMVKDADIYIESKDYKGAQSVLHNIVVGDKLNNPPEVIYPAESTQSQREKIKEEAEKRYTDQLKWIEEGAYKYAVCSAKLGDKQAVESIVSKYKEAFPKGLYLNAINNLPEPEAANKQ